MRIAQFCGAGAILLGAALLALAILTASESAFNLYFFGFMGLCAAAFGVWMLVSGFQMAKLRATVTAEALHIVAHAGRHLALQRGLAEATIPWAEIQGITDMHTLNMSAATGTQTTYILYTSRGDFTLNDIQWDDLPGLIGEISARTGRAPGQVAAERAVASADVKAGKRRLFAVLRIFGWTVIVLSAAMLLLVIAGGFIQGFSRDLLSAGFMLMFAISLGYAMVRYYRPPV
jgi:hypothetical protein